MTIVDQAPRLGIRVYGTPIPQGSKTANRYGGGVRDANAKKLKPWRDHVRDHAADTLRYHDQLTGPVAIWLTFTFQRPPSHYRTGANAHLLRAGAPLYPGKIHGDIDKLTRAILDALTDAEAWNDDTQVVDLRRIRKFYVGDHELALPRAGVDIVLEDLTPQQGAL